MFFTFNVNAETVPTKVLEKYNLVLQTKPYAVIAYYNGSYFICYGDYQDKPVVRSSDYALTFIEDGKSINTSSRIYRFETSDNGNTFNFIDGSSSFKGAFNSSGKLLFSNFDIYIQVENTKLDVFFSVPAPPFLPAKETTSLVPIVGKQSVPILVVSVAILALMMAATLIPRVLYRLL